MENRRAFLRSILGATALVSTPSLTGLPQGSTDSHHHIYDSRFPQDPTATLHPPDATVKDYRVLQKQLGTTRHVIVQPSTYGVDNSCLLDALHQFGAEARGIAVVNTAVSDAELKRLNAGGVRGLRFNLVQAGATTPEMIEPLSKRIAPLGWHIQVNASSEQIQALADTWTRIPVPVVFDHFGHVWTAKDPAFAFIAKLMQQGKAWTKLASVETLSKAGPPHYPDSLPIAQAFIREAPDRLIWGSNWPYVTSKEKPDPLLLFHLLSQWAKDQSEYTKILVHNPAHLFGF